MNEITTDLLLYAKAFCLKAEEEARRGTLVDQMMAVMHMQDAVEFCLNAIIYDQSISSNIHDNFHTLWKLVNEHFKSLTNPRTLPFAKQMDFLNTTRGKIKHYASVPSPQDMDRCLIDGRKFLERVFQDYFGAAFSSLSLASMVEEAAIRDHLQKAEQQIEGQEYIEALISIGKAFDLAEPRKGLLGDADYTLLLIRMGTDMRRLHRVRSNLPMFNPILVPDDTGASPLGLRAGKLSIHALDSLDTSKQAVEETLQTAVEIILHWQDVGMIAWEMEQSHTPGTLRHIRTEELA
jgi:hypothetical protein